MHSHLLIQSPKAHNAQTWPIQNQELRASSRSPMCMQGPQYSDHLPLCTWDVGVAGCGFTCYTTVLLRQPLDEFMKGSQMYIGDCGEIRSSHVNSW